MDTETLAQVKTAVVLDEANKDKYDAVLKVLEPETENQKKNLEQASKDKAAGSKGGNTGMIVGIVLSVLAVVVIGGVVYKCSQKEEEEAPKEE